MTEEERRKQWFAPQVGRREQVSRKWSMRGKFRRRGKGKRRWLRAPGHFEANK